MQHVAHREEGSETTKIPPIIRLRNDHAVDAVARGRWIYSPFIHKLTGSERTMLSGTGSNFTDERPSPVPSVTVPGIECRPGRPYRHQRII